MKQEPETRAVNGLVQNGGEDGDDDDDDDLPPLGGEDSDKENERVSSVNTTPPAKTSDKLASRENFSPRVTQRSVGASASGRVRNHARPSVVEEDVVPFRLVSCITALV